MFNNEPGVVMGSVLLYLMSSQLSAGLQMLSRSKAVFDFNSGIIIGFPLMIALIPSSHERSPTIRALEASVFTGSNSIISSSPIPKPVSYTHLDVPFYDVTIAITPQLPKFTTCLLYTSRCV